MSRRPSRSRRRGSPSAEVDQPRLVAYSLLRQVADQQAYANLAMPKLLKERSLGGTDAAFATELAFGTLRLQGRYDAIIALCSSRPLAQIDERVLDVLRLGAHQLLAMRVPDYAAVNSSAAMIRRVGRSGAAGFVNAVLRRIAGTDLTEWLQQIPPDPQQDPDGHTFAAESHPRWIGTALADSLATQQARAELPELLAANNRAAPVTLVARPGRMDTADLLAMAEGEPGQWSPWAVRNSGDPGRIATVRDGRVGVQDEGSQLVTLAWSRAEVTGTDDRWLDMCAGPGGKTAILAGLAAQKQAELVAVEQHSHRAELVRQALPPDSEAEVLVADSRELTAGAGFSRILLDAPCTGIGAVRRRPELRWRRTAADLPGLRQLQTELLNHAVALLRPGGVIGYITCSPHLAETDDIIAAALTQHDELRQLPAAELLPEVPDATAGYAVRLWPHRHDTDGMYLAVLQRRG
ncbi:MAG: rRNA cytosine-C5-methyltransferase [Actinomycetia bacterium]|nr:rRNA cytosine-C5-methyltransferase [Actinomycetes bacterium]MCH9800579.1 rRNA cytosine-C5-methyltransferase [Actinomycetes bacterium]